MAAGAAVAGTALSAVGSLRAGQAQASASEYNAKNAEESAAQTRAQATEEARRVRLQSRKQIGQARANYGASGITTEGSALDVLEESAATAELDAQTIKQGGETKARSFEQFAALERYKGKNAQIAGYLGAASSATSAAGKMA